MKLTTAPLKNIINLKKNNNNQEVRRDTIIPTSDPSSCTPVKQLIGAFICFELSS